MKVDAVGAQAHRARTRTGGCSSCSRTTTRSGSPPSSTATPTPRRIDRYSRLHEAGALTRPPRRSRSTSTTWAPLDKILDGDPQGGRAPAPQGRAEAADRRHQDLPRRRHAHRQRLHARALGREQDLLDRRPGLSRRAVHPAASGWCRWCGRPSSRACSSRPTASATARCTPCSTPTRRSTSTTPVAPTRPCITHSNFMSREAIEKAARLGVVVDIQPAWLYLDTRTLAAQFGYDRLRYFQPLHSLFEAGVIAGGGSDHMQKIGSLRSINPYNPFLGMWVAITRRAQGLRGPAPPRGGPDPRAGDPVLHDQQRPPAVPGGPDRLARGGQAGGLRRHRPRPPDLPGGRDPGGPRPGHLSRRQTRLRTAGLILRTGAAMSIRTDRRRFLRASATGGALLGLGDLGFLSRLRPVSADEANLDPKVVRLQPEIEPLVRLLEETPRERLLEEVAARVQKGTELSRGARGAAAGRRAERAAAAQRRASSSTRSWWSTRPTWPASPRPTPTAGCRSSGRSTTSRARRRRTSARGTGRWARWTSRPSRPPARPARRSPRRWTAGTRRRPTRPSPAWPASAGANEVYELFFRYGARDFRSIGHKAIYVANSWRTLQCIGWQHAEPVLRSLAYALLMHEGGNPARPRRPGRPPLAAQPGAARPGSRTAGTGGKPDAAAAADLLATLRTGSDDDACRAGRRAAQPRGRAAVDLGRPVRRRRRAAAAPAGDRLAARGDLDQRAALRLPGQRRRPDPPAAAAPERRVPHPVPRGDGRARQGGRRADRSARTDRDVGGRHRGPIEEIFAEASRDRTTAARKALAYLQAGRDPRTLIDAARRLVFLKGNDAHDYKFSSAVLEDYYHASPAWRDRYLASSLLLLPGSADRDNDLVRRTRAALNA